jgi:FixJ family two-component response regulator
MIDAARLSGTLLPLRVYVVDPHEATGRSLAALLEVVGLKSAVFRTVDALVSTETEPEPGFIVLDPGRSGEAGLRTLARVRELGWPVIVTSASFDRAFAARCLAQGAADFIDKPFAPGDIMSALSRLAERIVVPSASYPRDSAVLRRSR